MTQEEKRLLEIELATRSQYGVICAIKPVAPFHDLPFGGRQKIKNVCIRENDSIFTFGPYEVHGVENIRPYLRPMSSMTEEERKEFRTLILPEASCAYEDCLEWDAQIIGGGYLQISVEDFSKVVDWLNAHHFDYRGLIEKGLALKAPEGMYKTE